MSNLAIYGTREDVLDLTKRLQATIPGGRKLSQEEALSLAQISVAHGLDPFNGEAWIIPGSGLMVGIKGLRKAARRAAQNEGGVFWGDYQLTPADNYNAPKDAIVYEYHLRDTVTTQAWAKAVNIMTSAGVPYKEAAQMAGPAPVVIGIGIATPDEKSKMPIHQRARKRAEADAIKQRYDVSLGGEFSADEPEFVEAEFEDDNSKPRDEDTILGELGYQVDYDAIWKAVVDAKLSENVHAARNALQSYCTTGYDTPEKAVAWMKIYRGWRDSGLEPVEAAANANNSIEPK